MRQSNKFKSFWRKWWRSLIGFLLLFLAFQRIYSKTNSNTVRGEDAIRKVFRGTKYESMIPLIIAQAKHETANFTSNVYRNTNNLFGMRFPRKRKAVNSGKWMAGDGSFYSKYVNDEQSAKDFLLYLDYTRFPIIDVNSINAYASTLKNLGYYEDSIVNYANGIRRWKK